MVVSLKERRKTYSEVSVLKAFLNKMFEAFLTDWKESINIIAGIIHSLSYFLAILIV